MSLANPSIRSQNIIKMSMIFFNKILFQAVNKLIDQNKRNQTT